MTLADVTVTFQTWTPRITGTLSTIGSSAIIYIIMTDRGRKLMKPKNRLMLCMSIFDCIFSVAMAFSTVAENFPGACQLQGICIWLGLAVPLYSSSLNLFYLLVIRYNVRPQYFSTKIEPYLHALSVLYPVTLAITAAILGLIVSLDGLCWTAGNEKIVRLGWGLPVLLSFIFCIFSMASIYLAVEKQEKAMDKYRFGTSSSNTEQKETRDQALLYASAFFLTFFSPVIEGIIRSQGEGIALNIFEILTVTFYPFQGFWNFLFYIRPGVKHVKKMNPDISTFGAIREVVFNAPGVAESFRRVPQASTIPNRFSPSSLSPSNTSPKRITTTLSDDDDDDCKIEMKKASRRVSFALVRDEDIQDNIANTIVQVVAPTKNDDSSIHSNAVDGGITSSKSNDKLDRRESLRCMKPERRESLSCMSSVLSLGDFEDGEDINTRKFSLNRRNSALSYASIGVIEDKTGDNACRPRLRSDDKELSNLTSYEIESEEV